MDFAEQLKQLSQRAVEVRQNIQTEEATKMSLIVPFFQILGYDVFNPTEFCPEYTADMGIKKGEKVDYAILENNEPLILIECKWCGETLTAHTSQLYRYFATTTAKFAILTNGICYHFFTDLDETNKMDVAPFLEIDITNLKENQINELKKFCKSNFDCENIFSTASELKYSNLIKNLLGKEIESPSDDFARFILGQIYDGLKTQKTIDKFKPIIRKSFTGFINDIVNQKISNALNNPDTEETESPEVPEEPTNKIALTPEKIEAFYIVRGLLAETTDIENIVYRDTESYFGILFQDNNRKPICRLNLESRKKYILIPNVDKTFEKFYIDSNSDLYKFKENLSTVVTQRYLSNE